MLSAQPAAAAWRRAHLLLLAVQVAGLYFIGRATPFEWGFPLDDAWIHQVVARTFAETGTLGYVPGRFGSAATSLLWAATLALNHALFALPPALFAFAINAALALGTGQLWLALLRADGFRPGIALVGAGLGMSAANQIWFAYSGMEATLVVFLSTLAVWLWLSRGRRPRLTAGLAGGAAALLFLTRPEAAAVAAVLTVTGVAVGRRGRDLAALWGILLLTVGATVAVTYASTGLLKPSTLDGRRILWLAGNPAASGLEWTASLLLIWAERLQRFTLGSNHAALFWLVLGCSIGGVAVLWRRRAWRFGTLVLWGLGHLAVYAVLLPTPGHGGRYQPLVPAIFVACAWLGVAALLEAAPSARKRRLARLVAALALAVPVLSAWPPVARGHHLSVIHVRATEVEMGRRVAALPPGARIGSFDIGGIGYFADRPIVDLGALVDPALTYALRDAAGWRAVDELQLDYLLVPETYDRDFPDPWNFYLRLGLHRGDVSRLEELERLETDRRPWLDGLLVSLHCAPAQTLFRVEKP